MGGNTGELQIGSEREMHQYINQAGTTKTSTRSVLIQMYNIFRLLIGVPDYSINSELSLQPMIPPNRVLTFSPSVVWDVLRKSRCVQIFIFQYHLSLYL